MALEVSNRRLLSLISLLAALLAGASSSLTGTCGPFTDVAADAFCPFVLEIFTLGITTGTTPTTYDPGGNVSRLQMAAFLSRSVDGVLRRASRRAAADKFYAPGNGGVIGTTTAPGSEGLPRYDGADVWVPANSNILRVRASDGRVLETWTGANGAFAASVAMGRVVFSAPGTGANPGRIVVIDPTQAPGAATLVASTLGTAPMGIAFDGTRFWTGNAFGGSVSIVTPQPSIPWTVTNTNVGLGGSSPLGVVFDGSNVWVTDVGLNTLLKLDSAGVVLQTVTVGAEPNFPVFDGANLWVPNDLSNSVSVVRASSGVILGTLTGNGLTFPLAAAFDGERILVTNNGGDSVSLWKAADLAPLGSAGTGAGTNPRGVCSDGLNFWITAGNKLLRF